MPDNFIGLYFLLTILGILIAYAGVDETLKLFTYLDLQLKYFFIKIQMRRMQKASKRFKFTSKKLGERIQWKMNLPLKVVLNAVLFG